MTIRYPQGRSLEPHLESQPLLPTSPPRCVQSCPSCRSSQEVVVYTGWGKVNSMWGTPLSAQLCWELPSMFMWHIHHAGILAPRAPVITTSPHFCLDFGRIITLVCHWCPAKVVGYCSHFPRERTMHQQLTVSRLPVRFGLPDSGSIFSPHLRTGATDT